MALWGLSQVLLTGGHLQPLSPAAKVPWSASPRPGSLKLRRKPRTRSAQVTRQAVEETRRIIAVAAGAGALVQRVAGYGGGLITLGTAAVFGGAQGGIDLSLLREVITILYIPLNFVNLYPNLKAGNIAYRSCLTFLGAALVAVPLGVNIVSTWDANRVFKTLGFLLAGHGAWQLIRKEESKSREPSSSKVAVDIVIGAAGGVLAGAFAAIAPAIAIGSTVCSWSQHGPVTCRGNLAFILGLITLAVFLVDASQGRVSNPEVWFTVAACVPSTALGVVLGKLINDSVPASVFKKFLQGILISYGALLIWKSS